jgi:hypothetical protein
MALGDRLEVLERHPFNRRVLMRFGASEHPLGCHLARLSGLGVEGVGEAC